MNDLERRLERLERIESAKVVTARYGRACDVKDVDRLRRDVFTPDIVLRVPDRELAGIDAVIGFYVAGFDAEPGTRRHFLMNQIAEIIDDSHVRVESYFLFVSADSSSVIGWGSYDDVVAFGADGPRIGAKTIRLDVHTTVDAGWADATLSSGS